MRLAAVLRFGCAFVAACAARGAGAGPSGLTAEQERAYRDFLEMGQVREFPATPWDKAFTFEATYYRVRTNTSPQVARYIGTMMDAQAVAMLRIFQFKMTLSKIAIWATRTREEFLAVGSGLLRQPISPMTGGFWTTANGGTIVLPYVQERGMEPGKVLLHEATHQFLHRAVGPRIPLWLNEGLAVYFEESRYNPVAGRLETGFVPRERLMMLQAEIKHGQALGLQNLLGATQMEFGPSHYGAAWSFIYWLLRSSDNKEALRRQKALNQYLFDLKAGKSTDHKQLFVYLGISAAEADKQWKEWVLGLDPEDERGGTRLPGE